MAAAAYMSCSRIYNDYDDITHDYTRKRGLVWEQIFLPEHAPREWSDRSVLWNAVESSEKSKDSRLARELIVALPKELSQEMNEFLLQYFVEKECVSKGMCAHVCYHDTDGHNPHAHIMLTVRPLNKDGTWQHKTEKEYLCVRNGEESGFTAAEFIQAERDGWEKQYLYKIGKKKEYLPPSQAEGLERVNKYPKSSKYGRQNPISEQWNSEEQLLHWRKMWARYVNRELEGCELDERIDHRSHKDRGLLEQPTIHEGVIAIAMERKGYISDRCEINRQIRKDNSFLRNIMNTIKYLIKTIFVIVGRIADEMEEVRVNMIALEYDRYKGYPDENTMQKHMQKFRALQEKAEGIDEEKLNAERMKRRPEKENEAKKRISDLYGDCQESIFNLSKLNVAKRLGEQPANVERNTEISTPSWLRGRKKKDDREER